MPADIMQIGSELCGSPKYSGDTETYLFPCGLSINEKALLRINQGEALAAWWTHRWHHQEKHQPHVNIHAPTQWDLFYPTWNIEILKLDECHYIGRCQR